MQENKLGYSRKEAAAASSLSVRTVDYLIREGRLQAVKIKGRVVIPAQALQKLLKA
jgi:excisionase family DNA binding protein